MKKTKFLAFLLALAMLFALSACGNNAYKHSSDDTSLNDPAISSDGENATDDLGPAVTLSVAEAGLPTSEWGLAWTEFKEYVKTQSNGNITIELYLSGNLGGYDEELGMLADGSVDMICIFPPATAFDLPAFCGMQLAFNSVDEALDMAHWVAYDNEETAKIYADQLAKYNSILLPCVIPTGVDAYVSTVEVNSWEELHPLKLGLASESQYAKMGFSSLVVIDTTQWYENLRTGVCETANMSAADVVSAKLYEVCKTLVMGNLYQTMGYFAINSDSWNALTPAQQQILTDASVHTEQWAAAYVGDLASQCVQLCEDAGMNVVYMTDEDCMTFMDAINVYGYPAMIEGLGGATGTVPEMATVCQAYLDYFKEHDDVIFNVDLSQYLG